MQDITGSVQQKSIHLTPFEQAEYNIAVFAANTKMNYELNTLLDRLAYLRNMKQLTLGMPQSGSFAAAADGYDLTLDNEISGIEMTIEMFCSAYADRASEA